METIGPYARTDGRHATVLEPGTVSGGDPAILER
jgi:hypothetical protein